MDKNTSVYKNNALYEGYALSADEMRNEVSSWTLREETDRFIEYALFDGPGTLTALLTDTTAFVTPGLAEYYGVAAPSMAWGTVQLNTDERAGVLTRGNFLFGHASGDFGSPIHRGLVVYERLLCRVVPPPPDNVDITPPSAGGGTNRDRFQAHVNDPQCQGCHALFDPMGFSFEHYDAIGGYRTLDNDLPVDATGTMSTQSGPVSFNDAVELSGILAQDAEVHRCLSTMWFRYAFGRNALPSESGVIDALTSQFAANNLDVRELLIAITKSDTFRFRHAPAL